ncbi:metabotropic glutamate receptor 2-like [Danaus plexippus]|uniref:metabotropic glutamate receptor 2-like n=1 Tax=Danaus plexippus TaxID=13037 RepID=UPI002AB1ED2A|nr:metabotropic glutamate receptor 2-like [Danaus plexippus]
MVLGWMFAVLLLAAVSSRHQRPRLSITDLNNSSDISIIMSNIEFVDVEEYYTLTDKSRHKRESHPLIGPFDMSKMSRNRKRPRADKQLQPTASLLLSNVSVSDVSQATSSTPDNTKNEITTEYITDTKNTPKENILLNNLERSTMNSLLEGDTKNIKLGNITSIVEGKSKIRNKMPRKSKSVAARKRVLNIRNSAESSVRTSDLRLLSKKKTDNESLWAVKHAAVVEGDIILGGLMMVHGRAGGSSSCGPLMAQGGVQALEAMLFSLDEAQRAGLAPPGVRLGALVLDDCDSDTRGLEMALDFIKGSIGNIDDEEYACNATTVRKVITGVVGASSSVTSVQVANLLRLFKIPQVSFFSTSPELSNKARFEYFTRTIPSDLHQVRALVEIVKKFGWRYVSIIYEESNYGIKAFEELETLLLREDICIAVKERLVKDSGAADDRAYDTIVERLLSRPRARGVIVFGSDQEVAGVMAAVGRRGAAGSFGWVGSDGWSARALVAAGNEPVVEGTISVQPQSNPVRGFRDYFLSLTPRNNIRNPWFVEFWEEQFRCRYPGSPRSRTNAQYEPCSGTERLSVDNTEFEAQLQFVTDAVWAFVYAIRDMHKDACGGKPGLCDEMRPVSGPVLLRYLRQVRFIGLSGDEFHFDSHGDGPARYNILHFKQVSQGVYRWVKVGRYLDGVLELNMDEIQFKWDQPKHPESVCSAECDTGQAKQYVEGESCCWHCFNCTQYEIRSPSLETSCVACPLGTLPDARRMHCAPVPELYLRPDTPAAIGAMAFSSLGILLTLVVGGVWIARRGTPVVRASGRELSGVLLAGIFMCYLVTFALVLRPTDFLCAVQRFATGFCFTVIYAALLTKTNRIARIFDASKQSARRPSLISPKSQLLICSILVSIQVVIVVVWQSASPARAIHHYPTREDNMLVCDSYVDASYTIAFFYPVVLIVVCTVYAVLTRKIPEAFNESKHIGFTMYTTCVIWLAFVPLYFGTSSQVPLRVTSMAVTISLSASVTLACLFAPKMHIILFHPERNVRGTLTASRWRGRGTAPGAVCAALVGAAPLPRSAHTPSTDLSTLDVTERSTSTDRQVQTDEIEPLPRNCAVERNGLHLDPNKLSELTCGLPTFDGVAIRRRPRDECTARLAVAVVGARTGL